MKKHCPASQRIPRARKVILIAVLIATTIILQRFLAIRTPIIQVNFMLVPILLAGIMLGWSSTMFIAVMADLIGALLFPSGSFFWGYTITATLTGLTAGICLYHSDGMKLDSRLIVRLIICIVIITGLFNGCLNTIWILITSGSASNIIVPIRIIKQLIMAPIMFIAMLAILKIFGPRINQLAFPKVV